MQTSCKIGWGIAILSLTAVVVMAYIFVVRGSVTVSADGRSSIALSVGERDLVLSEMRGFLESIQAITTGLASNDMGAIAAGAKAVGAAHVAGVPATLMGKLPIEFKILGNSTHAAFDDLAVEAQGMGDVQVILGKLGDLMQKCTSCHAGYRLDIETVGQQAK